MALATASNFCPLLAANMGGRAGTRELKVRRQGRLPIGQGGKRGKAVAGWRRRHGGFSANGTGSGCKTGRGGGGGGGGRKMVSA